MKQKNIWTIWFALFGLVSFAIYYFGVNMAIQNPQIGLALEIISEDEGFQSQSRVKLNLLFGADPNLPIEHWNVENTPLVEAVIRNKEAIVSILLLSSDQENVLKATKAACVQPGIEKSVLILLAQHLQVDPHTLCKPES